MAQEVQSVMPQAVVRGNDGYLRVDYARLGMRMKTWSEWLNESRSKPLTDAQQHW